MKLSIQVARHRRTGWLIATSKELPELLVQGKDLEQVMERAPSVIRRILERRCAAG